MDDTLVIWPHGPGKLTDYLHSVHEDFQFTTEMERDCHLPFIDTNIYRKPDGSLGHRVHHKPTSISM
jgi:hypothetical protein